MRILLYLSVCLLWLDAGMISVSIAPPLKNNLYMGIKLLDQRQLLFSDIDGVKFTELSDVTYDSKGKILYFVGDRGSLFAFDANIGEHIESFAPIYATKLKTKRGKKLRRWKRDSEGLTLDGKNRLLVSFEGKAKVGWFHKNGKKIGQQIRKYKLPKALRDTGNYRSKNKSLEALAWHKKYGTLTAAEWPLKRDDKKRQTIYALDGRQWHFKAEPEPRSALVAIEVMDDGNLLVLERSYTNLLSPLVITLKKVMIESCKQELCPTKVLAKMNNHKGWSVDNFEGLARISKNRYIMVSDDNDNFFQKTLLIYFEVM